MAVLTSRIRIDELLKYYHAAVHASHHKEEVGHSRAIDGSEHVNESLLKQSRRWRSVQLALSEKFEAFASPSESEFQQFAADDDDDDDEAADDNVDYQNDDDDDDADDATWFSPDANVVSPPLRFSIHPARTHQPSDNPQQTAVDTLAFLNVVVSSGRVSFTKQLLDSLKPSVSKLCLDGRNMNHDSSRILQCFGLLRESNTCVSMSEFEACSYESSSWGPSYAVAILKNLPVERTRIQSLKLQQFSVNDDVMKFCCEQFPSLTCLDVGNNEALRNVPAAIRLLTQLVTLNVCNCSNLSSLPDELLHLRTTLRTISTAGCSTITFPPPSICAKGKDEILKHLKNVENAKPLRRVKVLFLGNGRSGKTSLLRALAKKPLRPGDTGPLSTLGVSVNTLGKEMKPGFLEKLFEQLPDITYWDFAGQLEYSAAHDFFLSARQAVFVIIFSVTDDRDSQMHQVACVTSLLCVHCLLAFNDASSQVLVAYCILARVAVCALLDCGNQGRPNPWPLGRCAEEA